MVTTNNDIVKCFGAYRMKLTPHLVKNEAGEVITEKSKAQVTMYDISQKLDLLWSTTMNINAAHGALTMFEMIGYYDMPIDTH
jgi:hypothetical protein